LFQFVVDGRDFGRSLLNALFEGVMGLLQLVGPRLEGLDQVPFMFQQGGEGQGDGDAIGEKVEQGEVVAGKEGAVWQEDEQETERLFQDRASRTPVPYSFRIRAFSSMAGRDDLYR
jgi:hypothetical protein